MLDRRAFLLSGLAVYGASAKELFAAGRALQNPKFPTSPFTLGVCSGDPAPDGVVLWTRLAIDPLNGGGMPRQPIEVQWQVATDDRLSRVVRSGKAMASPDWGHSVHVEVTGLQPHTLVLVSVPRRRRVEPHRPHAHVSARAVGRRSASLRHCVVPALRGRPLHGVPAHGRGRSRPRDCTSATTSTRTPAETNSCGSTWAAS